MEQKIEIWRPVVGFEGSYEVSSFGNVRSTDRVIICSNGVVHNLKGKQMKQSIDYKGYLRLQLFKNGCYYSYRVHRLVAMAFIPNPLNLPYINHKDENKLNNSVDNLEWCTNDYNVHYGTAIERKRQKFFNHPYFSKPVLCVELNKTFPSINEAGRWIGKDSVSKNICACCKGKRKTTQGYHWQYVDTKEDAN